jgi:hypothetical protein
MNFRIELLTVVVEVKTQSPSVSVDIASLVTFDDFLQSDFLIPD